MGRTTSHARSTYTRWPLALNAVSAAFVPVLITVNTVGSVIYQATRSSRSRKVTKLVEQYLSAQRDLNDDLVAKYDQLIEIPNIHVSDSLTVLERAFSPDVVVPTLGSVELTTKMGVDEAEVLDTEERALNFFLA